MAKRKIARTPQQTKKPAENPAPHDTAPKTNPYRPGFHDLAGLSDEARRAVDEVLVASHAIRDEAVAAELTDHRGDPSDDAIRRRLFWPWVGEELDRLQGHAIQALGALLVLQTELLDRWRETRPGGVTQAEVAS